MPTNPLKNQEWLTTKAGEGLYNLFRIKKYLPVIVAVVALAATGFAVSFYMQLRELRRNPQQIAQEEVQQVVGMVGRLIVLPEGETPTLATVTDQEKLRSQPFFALAKNGDKVLIYTNAKKAILYDLVANKIVEVAPLNIGN